MKTGSGRGMENKRNSMLVVRTSCPSERGQSRIFFIPFFGRAVLVTVIDPCFAEYTKLLLLFRGVIVKPGVRVHAA